MKIINNKILLIDIVKSKNISIEDITLTQVNYTFSIKDETSKVLFSNFCVRKDQSCEIKTDYLKQEIEKLLSYVDDKDYEENYSKKYNLQISL